MNDTAEMNDTTIEDELHVATIELVTATVPEDAESSIENCKPDNKDTF